MVPTKIKRLKLHLDIALTLARKLVPNDIAETVDWLQAEENRETFVTGIDVLVSRVGPRVVRRLEAEGVRTESVRAFLSLARDERFVDAMAALAVEMRIADAAERKKEEYPNI